MFFLLFLLDDRIPEPDPYLLLVDQNRNRIHISY